MLIHKKHSKAVFTIVILVLALVTVVPVAAQGDDGETPPCEGDSVSGTVVAVDEETEMVTIDTGEGLCVVTLDGGHDHPIVALLGSYFGGVSADGLAAALETTQSCAVQDPESGTWEWADCDAEGAVAVTVVGENEDGSFTATVEVEGEDKTITVTVEDTTTAESLREALDALAVDWELQVVDEEGTVGVVDGSDEIATYHEDGLGFGVLVKLYAMAAKSGVPVEELVAAFQSGTGMGELFEEYGRPSILGIGHIKQQAKAKEHIRAKEHKGVGPPDHAGPKGDDADKGGGPPDHAGPKSDGADKGGGPPDHAGPKK